ncbi:MAG: nuclear transport factor 2 family protein [Bacteroidota bacterium]
MNLSKLLFCCLSFTLIAQLSAQATEMDDRAAVAKVIHTIFDGMKNADSSGLAALFHPEASLKTVFTNQEGEVVLRGGSISNWLEGMSSASAGDWVEHLYQVEIRIDAEMATAWTPYRFDYQGQVSHCGVNNFQFVKTGTDGQWQVAAIIDTRRREGCPELPEGSEEERLNKLVDNWHEAAAKADSAAYFGAMAENSIFIGTDPAEHWTREAFISFAAPYFAKGNAWDFTATERHLFISPDSRLVYWDELLDTWMGPCRGTGVAERQFDGSYLIEHYTLSVTIPNDKIENFIDLLKVE